MTGGAVLRRGPVPVPEPGRGLQLGGVDGGGPAGAYLDASAGEGLQQQSQRRGAGGKLLQVGSLGGGGLRGVVDGRRGGMGARRGPGSSGASTASRLVGAGLPPRGSGEAIGLRHENPPVHTEGPGDQTLRGRPAG